MDLKLCEDPSIYEENKYICLRDYFFRYSRGDFYKRCVFLNQCGLRMKIEDSEIESQTQVPAQTDESIKTLTSTLGTFLVSLIIITIFLFCIIRICLIAKISRQTRSIRATNPRHRLENSNPEEPIDQDPPTYADTVLSDDELPKYDDSVRSEPNSTSKLDKTDERHLD